MKIGGLWGCWLLNLACKGLNPTGNSLGLDRYIQYNMLTRVSALGCAKKRLVGERLKLSERLRKLDLSCFTKRSKLILIEILWASSG